MIVLSLYAPLNRTVRGGWQPKTKLDDYLPFWPVFIYPYLLAYVWIPILYVSYMFQPFANQMQLTIATLIACGIGYTCFYLFPSYVSCSEPKGNGITLRLLQLLHKVDNENNACPSMHVYMAVLLGYFSWSSSALINLLVLLAAGSVAFSTVLIKRHYVLDVIGGGVVGTVSIVFTILWL